MGYEIKFSSSILTVIILVIPLFFLLTLPVQSEYLSRQIININITVEENYAVEVADEELFLDLAEGVKTNPVNITVLNNIPLTMRVNSREGFEVPEENEDSVNKFFEYVLSLEQEETEKEVWSFRPGERLDEGFMFIEPGVYEWSLILRLEEEMAETWELFLQEDFARIDFEVLGDEWTQLAAGEYEDELIITFFAAD